MIVGGMEEPMCVLDGMEKALWACKCVVNSTVGYRRGGERAVVMDGVNTPWVMEGGRRRHLVFIECGDTVGEETEDEEEGVIGYGWHGGEAVAHGLVGEDSDLRKG